MGVDTVYRPRIHLVQSDPRREGVGFQLRERYEAATTGRVRGGILREFGSETGRYQALRNPNLGHDPRTLRRIPGCDVRADILLSYRLRTRYMCVRVHPDGVTDNGRGPGRS